MNPIVEELSRFTLGWVITSPAQDDASDSGFPWWYTSNLTHVKAC